MGPLESRIIRQRQFGILAPERDLDQVRTLKTRGLATCFALGIGDRYNRVGMLAHVDYVDIRSGFWGMVEAASKELLALGAERVIVETANLTGKSTKLRGRDLERLLKTIQDSGLRVGEKFGSQIRLHGKTRAALYSPETGLYPISENTFMGTLTPEQLAFVRFHYGSPRGLVGDFWRIGSFSRFQLAYYPSEK